MSIQDIEKIVRSWAKRSIRGYNIDIRTIPQPDSKYIEIDWNKVKFTTESSWFEEEEEEEIEENLPRYPVYMPSYIPSYIPPVPQPVVPSQLVFKSNYTNTTSDDQVHIFSMKRFTEDQVETKMTQGFSRDGMVGVKIGVPDEVFEKTGNFGSDIAIEYADQNTVNHTMLWGLNSKIKAVAKKKTIAELRVTEDDYKCDFGAKVTIHGRVVARVFDHVTGTLKIVEGDIVTVLKNERDQGRFRPDTSVKFQGNKITWTVGGKLKFKFGIFQSVKVWNEDLP